MELDESTRSALLIGGAIALVAFVAFVVGVYAGWAL